MKQKKVVWLSILLSAGAISGCVATPNRSVDPAGAVTTTVAHSARVGATGPLVDHHQHLLSPAAVPLFSGSEPKPVQIPGEVAELLRRREAAWNNAAALTELYTEDAIVVEL